jgi:hypothetical protein
MTACFSGTRCTLQQHVQPLLPLLLLLLLLLLLRLLFFALLLLLLLLNLLPLLLCLPPLCWCGCKSCTWPHPSPAY